MMRLTINKGLSDETTIALTSYYERPLAGSFTGTQMAQVKKASDFPNYSSLTANMEIQSLELVDGYGLTIPLSGSYNHLDDVNCTYDDDSRMLRGTIALSYVPVSTATEED